LNEQAILVRIDLPNCGAEKKDLALPQCKRERNLGPDVALLDGKNHHGNQFP
jgi:hypothetical protein